MNKDVALVLSSGGPRGFAYIGAIEELQSRGYNITSVAGCSVGSLVGGIFAAGGLEAFKEWIYDLDNFKLLSLVDVSLSKNFLVKGDKVIEAIKEIVPDRNIEDLEIPFTAVATDLYSGEEVIFNEGNLFQAIRASISIPSMFRPVKIGHRTLVDGGIVNTMPLNRVKRNGNDILVGFDVNNVDSAGINSFLRVLNAADEKTQEIQTESLSVWNDLMNDKSLSVMDKIKKVGDEGGKYIKKYMDAISAGKKIHDKGVDKNIPVDADDNYYSILMRSFGLMNHTIAKLQIEAIKPDVLVSMSMDSFGTITDYAKAEEISLRGRELMAAALDEYEK